MPGSVERQQKKKELQEKRFRERVLNYITEVCKGPEDYVYVEDIERYMTSEYNEYERINNRAMEKYVSWHLQQIYQENTGLNISKEFYKKKDFLKIPNENSDNKQKNPASGEVVPEDTEQEVDGKPVVDDLNEKLIYFKSPNLLNQALPFISSGGKAESDNQADSSLGKRQAPSQDEEQAIKAPRSKRQNQGYAEFLKQQQQKDTQKELANKYKIQSNAKYEDLGGLEDVIKQLKEMIEWPLQYKNIFEYLGVRPPRGILISGPAGTGKSLLALAICGENPNIPFYKLNGPQLVSALSGQSEENIRGIFAAVRETAPAIIFIDELDSIAGKRQNAAKDLEIRIVAQLSACLDEIDQSEDGVIVIGATNRPESIDQGLRRAGRFEREIALGVPNDASRIDILRILTKKMRLRKDFPFEDIAKLTPGYVGADITTLCKEASIIAVERIINAKAENENEAATLLDEGNAEIYIEAEDFRIAGKRVKPSAQREGFSTVPNTSWADVGALSSIRQELNMSIVEPILNPQRFNSIGLTAPAGVLLYGPPGCGKTLVAKAVSNESKANFISIKGPELLNKYVGESEKAVRELFKRASASAPCIIFFDELDSLVPKRGAENNSSSERVVNQLLTEMDGLTERRNVFVIAATNRPDIIDSAMLRPGRLDKLLFVPLPTQEDRLHILKTLVRKVPIAEDVQLQAVASSDHCEGFSGADLSALVREAQLNALKTSLEQNTSSTNPLSVSMRDFTVALQKVFPSVSKQDENKYVVLSKTLRKSRSHITASTQQ